MDSNHFPFPYQLTNYPSPRGRLPSRGEALKISPEHREACDGITIHGRQVSTRLVDSLDRGLHETAEPRKLLNRGQPVSVVST